MATHSSVLAWRIPGTPEPVGLPSMGSQRVGHDWSDSAAAAAAGPPHSGCPGELGLGDRLRAVSCRAPEASHGCPFGQSQALRQQQPSPPCLPLGPNCGGSLSGSQSVGPGSCLGGLRNLRARWVLVPGSLSDDVWARARQSGPGDATCWDLPP